MPARRPLLNPALRRSWRGPATLQLGLDPARAVVLDGVGPAETAFLALLDGTREHAAVLAAAQRLHLARDRAERLLRLLEQGGALDDGAADLGPVAALPPAERDRLRPDLAAWSLLPGGCAGAARRLARRRAAQALVLGSGRLAAAVTDALGEAAVGRVTRVDVDTVPSRSRPGPDRPLLTVLADATPGPAGDWAARAALLAGGIPHLVAVAYETLGQVGPLVVPGRTPCLRCLDLHRRDRDPGWPLVAAQVTRRRGDSASAPSDGTLVRLVAAQAALAALAHLDDPAATGPLEGGLLELRLPYGRARRRSWAAHPACGCRWPGSAARMAG